MQAGNYQPNPPKTEWHTAPDGRRFKVYLGRCVCRPCWQARCECGHRLTAHDFDADCARRSALDELRRTDPLGRPDFAHPPEQCHPTGKGRQ